MNGQHVVIWGTGKEGRAAAAFIEAHFKPASLTFVDETPNADASIITDVGAIKAAIDKADVVVKSPGVSLYHPLLANAKAITSLLNLWLEQKPQGRIITITGTKGKSTTSALLGHVLNALGHKTAVLGNIGVPVTEAPQGMDFLVLEMSSYQTADFKGSCDIAAMTSLYPEHLNWHGDLDTYYRDKLNLLTHAKTSIVHPQVKSVWPSIPQNAIICADAIAADVPNEYLARAHNLANVGVVLAIIKALGFDTAKALTAMRDFKGLPHRQQELGIKNDILFVDDSIATTPQAAIAAMETYKGKPITLIAGGYDRGIDYAPLISYINAQNIHGVITMGPSGQRINDGLAALGRKVPQTQDMQEAVKHALNTTPANGVILLSPAAPSFGLFRDYIARGAAFAKEAGF